MKRTLCISSLLIALAISFSFAQKEANEKQVACDTIHRVIIDSVTINHHKEKLKEFKESQDTFLDKITFTVNAAGTFATITGIFVAIIGILAAMSVWRANNEVAKLKEEQKKQNEKLEELKNMENSLIKLKEELNSLGNELQKKSDTSFRFMSEIYKTKANGYFKGKDIQEYFYNMNYYYRFLMEIEELNKCHAGLSENYELLKAYLEDLEESGNKNIILTSNRYICWYNENLLKFIERCKEKNDDDCFDISKLIYNVTLDKINLNNSHLDIIKELENFMKDEKYKDEDISKVLKLANEYKYTNKRNTNKRNSSPPS